MDKWDEIDISEKMDKWEEMFEWEKMDQYGQILTKHNMTVTEHGKNGKF